MNHAWNPFLRFPRASLLCAAALCLPLVALLPRFRISSEARVLLEGDQRNLTSYEKVKRILANVEVAVISMECADVFSLEGIEAVRRVCDAFQRLPSVQDVKSLTHSVRPVRQGVRFEMVPLVPSGLSQPEQLAEFKRFCLDNPLIRDVMVAADGKHTLLTVTFRDKFTTTKSQERLGAQIEATLAPFRREGIRFQTLAMPLIEGEIRATLRSDVKRFLPASMALLVLTLGWTFRSGRILLLVLVNQGVVLLLLPGVMQLSGLTLSVFTVMLFPLLSGIHLAQLAHVYSAFQTAQFAGHPTDEAIQLMLRDVFKPCLFSLVTTAIGLLSLALSEVVQIREFGMLGTLGVCLVFLMTFGPGLALMQIVFTHRPLRPPSDPGRASAVLPNEIAAASALAPATPAWIEWMTAVVRNHGKLMIAIVAAVTLLSWFGLEKLRTDIRAVEFLNRRSVTRQAVEELDKVYGGINVVQIEIDSGATNGINRADFLQYVERIQRYAESQPGVSASYSYAQLLAMINQIWEGGRAEALRLPENPLLINLFVAALKSQNYPFLTALCDESFRTAYLVVRTPDMPSDRYLAIIHEILRHAEQTKPAQVTVSAAAGIHSILEADRRILRSQMNTFGGSTVVIGLVLTLLWRSPWLALLSLTTNAIPVALVLAFAGFAGVPLNSINIMVAAICLGIMVDDSIHFITHWRDERRQGFSAGDAVAAAFRVKGRPMVFTSWILIAIFSIFWFSSFPPVVQFGGLSAIAFAGAVATVLFFLPAVLCMFRSRANIERSTNRQRQSSPPGEAL